MGIYNTGDRRLAEYTPDRDWQMGGGEAASYGQLLTGETHDEASWAARVRPMLRFQFPAPQENHAG